jgi:hypothetical protein
MERALGISIHTGWAACVAVGGSLRKPEILANEVVQVLTDPERFCFHAATEMQPAEAEKWIATLRSKAIGNASIALRALADLGLRVCGICAKEGEAGDLRGVLGSHPRIHAAEGFFYRDVFRAACPVPSRIIAPASLDVSRVGKLGAPPWGRDQKLAALAAWTALDLTPFESSERRHTRGRRLR